MKNFRLYQKELLGAFKRNDLTLLAAAQAYYYLLSVVPLLFVLFALIPYFQIEPGEAIQFLRKVLPSEMAQIFETNIINIVQVPKNGLLTIGIIGSLWSASNGINAFIRSANRAYEVEETRNFIHVRVIALILTLGIIVSFIVAILLPILLTVVVNILRDFLGTSLMFSAGMEFVRWLITIVILTLILYMLFRFAPNKSLPLRYLLPGALIASILWQLITVLFSVYIANFANYSATYGSLGGLIILVIWFFITGLILMLGIEINATYYRIQSNKIKTPKG